MATPLPDDIAAEVSRLFDEGEEFADSEQDVEALSRFRTAWELLPEPKGQWQRALEIVVAIADSYFHLGDYPACHRMMQGALTNCGGEVDNPFIRLRLGQCLFEMGDFQEAKCWMVPAYLAEGNVLFEAEDPKYLAFTKEGLDPPPGGWPEGWK
jgi:hypothetical protein